MSAAAVFLDIGQVFDTIWNPGFFIQITQITVFEEQDEAYKLLSVREKMNKF
jgi:hypothetical protein